MFTSWSHIQWVGEVTCVCICRKTSVHVLVSWLYFHRTNPRLDLWGILSCFLSQSFSRGPAVEGWYTHSENSSSSNIGQFIGKISTRSGRRAADQCTIGPAYSPTHTHTHTTHLSSCVRTTTAAPLTRRLRPDREKRLLVTQTGCPSLTLE